MTIDEFWQLIDETREKSGSNTSMQAELLEVALSDMSEEDIIDYQKFLYEYSGNAYRRSLWNAAYIIGEGCGDDGFTDFRAWLIGQGKAVYEAALENPEILVDYVRLENRYETQAEELLYVAIGAFEKKTGKDIYETIKDIPRKHFPLVVDSNCWDSLIQNQIYEDCVKRAYPKLWAKFGW